MRIFDLNHFLKFFCIMSMVALFLGACSLNRANQVIRDEKKTEFFVRDSLRAKFVLTFIDSLGKEQKLDAVLFSVPGKRYRMEFTGPMGIGVASLLWTNEKWNIVFPTEKLYMSGVGYMVGFIQNDAIPMVPIHQVANIFDGFLIPEESNVLSEKDSLDFHIIKAQSKTGMIFTYGKKGEHVLFFSRIGRDGVVETLKYSDFKTFDGVNIPENIVFEREGMSILKIKIKKVTRKTVFSHGVWRLNIPKSYKRIGI